MWKGALVQGKDESRRLRKLKSSAIGLRGEMGEVLKRPRRRCKKMNKKGLGERKGRVANRRGQSRGRSTGANRGEKDGPAPEKSIEKKTEEG